MLNETPIETPADQLTSDILSRAAAERFERLLPAKDKALHNWLARVRWLSHEMPDAPPAQFIAAEPSSIDQRMVFRFAEARRAKAAAMAGTARSGTELRSAPGCRRRKHPSKSPCPPVAWYCCSTKRASRPCWRRGSKNISDGLRRLELAAGLANCCCICSLPMAASSRSPTTWPVFGRTPIPLCGKNSEVAIPSTLGPRIRWPNIDCFQGGLGGIGFQPVERIRGQVGGLSQR